MKLLPTLRKHEKEAIAARERKAELEHKKNINKIVQARKKADTLKRVLKENNITIELAKAIGH